jgi:hypothetical protein
MANHDFVTPYDARMEAWLEKQGFPHPKANPQNRFPTKKELFGAVAETGALEVQFAEKREFFAVKKGTKPGGGYEIRIGCRDWDRLGAAATDSITMHGYFQVELLLLEILSRECGQLLLYPDTGAPAVIVHSGMDTGKVYEAWTDSLKQRDCWDYFYRNIGGLLYPRSSAD